MRQLDATRGNQPNQKIPQTNRILLAVAAARERRARAAEGPRRPRPRDAAVKAVLAELGRVQRLATSHTQPHKVRFDKKRIVIVDRRSATAKTAALNTTLPPHDRTPSLLLAAHCIFPGGRE